MPNQETKFVKSRAQDTLTSNWVNIVSAVISIIQGLAFNYLAGRLPEIYQHSRATGDLILLVHFLLCFAILLRIFQTYVTAVLDYNFGLPSFFEILLIFVIGALEYFLFSSLDLNSFNIVSFHKRLTILSVLGMVGYIITIIRILNHEELFRSYKEYSREVILQMVNLTGMVILIGISCVLIFFPIESHQIMELMVVAMTLSLCFNIYFSLRTTFARRVATTEIATEEQDEETTSPSPAGPKLDVDISQPDREDVIEICELLIDHFGYVYSAIFDTSKRLTFRLIKRILTIHRGHHPLGFKSFFIARDRTSGKTVGMLLLKTASSDTKFGTFFATMTIAAITFFHLGIIGVFRTWHNWKALASIVPKVQPDELNIVYVAVNSNVQGRNVGKQLIEYSKGIAREQRKKLVTVDVRNINTKALAVFKELGFIMQNVTTDPEAETLLGQGPTIRMTLSV